MIEHRTLGPGVGFDAPPAHSPRPSARAASPAAEALRLLADPTRLAILRILSDGERNVSALCELLGLSQPTVSHHLGLMRAASVLTARRDGKNVWYGLDSSRVRLDGERERIIVAVPGLDLAIGLSALPG